MKIFLLKSTFIFEKFVKFDIPNPIVEFCQGTSKDCKFYVQICLLKSFGLPSYDVVHVLKKFKNVDVKTKLEISNPTLVAVMVASKMADRNLLASEIRRIL